VSCVVVFGAGFCCPVAHMLVKLATNANSFVVMLDCSELGLRHGLRSEMSISLRAQIDCHPDPRTWQNAPMVASWEGLKMRLPGFSDLHRFLRCHQS
jgi:hypothetical protein